MIMDLATSRRSSIAVQITGDVARLLQIERRRSVSQVGAIAEVTNPKPREGYSEEWAALLRREIRIRGFRGTSATTCVPPERLLVRHAKVVPEQGDELRTALLFELEDAFPDDAPMLQSVLVGEVMERGQRLNEHIMMAVGVEKLNDLVEFLRQAGLQPNRVDVEAAALLRCFGGPKRRESDTDNHVVIVHVGDSVTLTVVASSDEALFMKQLPIGMSQIRRDLSERLDLGWNDLKQAMNNPDVDEDLRALIVQALRLQIDSLIQEVAACLRYHAASRRSPAGVELVLCGIGAMVPGFGRAVADGLGQAHRRADPFTAHHSRVEPTAAIGGTFPSWCVPLGLALSGYDV